MRKVIFVTIIAIVAMTAAMAVDEPITPVSYKDVRFTSGVFAVRQRVNTDVTLPYILEQCEESGRIRNFELAGEALKKRAGGDKGFSGKPASNSAESDSDVYRMIEGISYSLAVNPDEELSEKLGVIVEKIKSAAAPDGTLQTLRMITGQKQDGAVELRNVVCLYNAGVAYEQATGDRTLLDAALKHAKELLKQYVGLEKLPAGFGDAGEDLSEFCLSTGNGKLLKLVTEDLEKRDSEFRKDLLGGRISITGGIGTRTDAGIADGKKTTAPQVGMFDETCVSISLLERAHGLFLRSGEASAIDVFERTLYNSVFAGVSANGDRHSTRNPLEYSARIPYNSLLCSWEESACCPTALMRLLATLGKYAYAAQGDTLYTLLYASGEVRWNGIQVIQTTEYPWDEKIVLKIGTEAPADFKLALRIPEWCIGRPLPSNLYKYDNINATPWTVTVNGKWTGYTLQHGFAVIDRTWEDGDAVELTLPMEIRRVRADYSIESLRNQVAYERGPIVYAFEACDSKDKLAHEVRYGGKNVKIFPEYKHELNIGMEMLHVVDDICDFTGIPYAFWGNRGRHAMRVWLNDAPPLPNLNQDKALFATPAASFIRPLAENTLSRINDASFPKDSLISHDTPSFSFRPHTGGTEWVTYTWEKSVEVSVCSIFWFENSDEDDGSCKVPESWKIRYLDGDAWKPVQVTEKNDSSVRFKPVVTTSLRLEVEQAADHAVGICEWLVR